MSLHVKVSWLLRPIWFWKLIILPLLPSA